MSVDAIIRGILANRNLPPRAIRPQDGSDWRSNMDVPGGLLSVGPRAPDTLRPGPAPTGSERVYDAIRGYLPGGQVFDRMAGGVAPVAAAFTTDAYDIGQDYAKTGRPAMLAMSLLPGAKPVGKAAQAAAWAGESALGKSFRAYHGSPHDFDRFDMSKIGTGEGAQAYGHGLYFAEGEPVAQSYKGALSKDYVLRNSIVEHAPGLDGAIKTALELIDKHGSPEAAKAALPLTSDGLRAAIDKVSASGLAPYKGRMYEVKIKANPDDFLDWDKPLSQQSQKVRGAIEGWLGPEYANSNLMTGASLAPTSGGTNKLPEIGIPGIRYLDQGSRGAGEGSRNYVVFDDKLIEIMRKYGLLGPAALGATAAGMPGDAEANDLAPSFTPVTEHYGLLR